MAPGSCAICQGQFPGVRHKHYADGILVLAPPPFSDGADYRLGVYWTSGKGRLKHVGVWVEGQTEAENLYHYCLCEANRIGARQAVLPLVRPPADRGKLPPRPERCGKCGNPFLDPQSDITGGRWECFVCGWTSDVLTIPASVTAEALKTTARRARPPKF